MNLSDFIPEMARVFAQAFAEAPKTISFFLGLNLIHADGNVEVVAAEVKCCGQGISTFGNVQICGFKIRFDMPCGIMS